MSVIQLGGFQTIEVTSSRRVLPTFFGLGTASETGATCAKWRHVSARP